MVLSRSDNGGKESTGSVRYFSPRETTPLRLFSGKSTLSYDVSGVFFGGLGNMVENSRHIKKRTSAWFYGEA